MPRSIKQLDFVKPGDVVSARRWNALVRAIKTTGGRNLPPARDAVDVYTKNELGETIPQFSVFSVEVGSIPNTNGLRPVAYLKAKKGGGDVLVTNGGHAIASGNWGTVDIIGLEEPLVVAVKSGESLVVGDECGPATGEFEVSKAGSGLYCLSNTTGGRAWVIKKPGAGTSLKLGITKANISARSSTTPGSGSCEFVSYSGGSLTPTGSTVTAYNLFSVVIATNTYVMLLKDEDGLYWIVSADC